MAISPSFCSLPQGCGGPFLQIRFGVAWTKGRALAWKLRGREGGCCLLAASAVLLGRRRALRSRISVVLGRKAQEWTELLVDGDSHSRDDISWALQNLRSRGQPVKTTIFAAPARLQNGKWYDFVREQGLRFHGVQRATGYKDPNDEAIVDCMKKLVMLAGVSRIALLTSDSDFLRGAQHVCEAGGKVVVLVPESQTGTRKTYADAGLEVVPIVRAGARQCPRVKAYLHSDGTGSLERCEPVQPPFVRGEVAKLHTLLEQLGLWQGPDSKLSTCIAKCWFANSLGTLTLFPFHCAISELHQALSAETGDCRGISSPPLAFFFPIGSGTPTAKQKTTFGGSRAASIFQGGGPFMLHDSDSLPSRLLRRLGYFDDHLNADLREAMLVFANMQGNKRLLREARSLPDPEDGIGELSGLLRQAFVSNACSGHWQLPPKDVDARGMLVRKCYLESPHQSESDVLEAMQQYSRRHGLPKMKTYLGNVWQLLRNKNSRDPSRRESFLLGLGR
ncbi:unnamed protein product [Symbiodinium sp. CCMP2592]|nr:unnamed protein product [Symbiodinium sp. CCMP2592]